jgi:hypothetical protein
MTPGSIIELLWAVSVSGPFGFSRQLNRVFLELPAKRALKKTAH